MKSKKVAVSSLIVFVVLFSGFVSPAFSNGSVGALPDYVFQEVPQDYEGYHADNKIVLTKGQFEYAKASCEGKIEGFENAIDEGTDNAVRSVVGKSPGAGFYRVARVGLNPGQAVLMTTASWLEKKFFQSDICEDFGKYYIAESVLMSRIVGLYDRFSFLSDDDPEIDRLKNGDQEQYTGEMLSMFTTPDGSVESTAVVDIIEPDIFWLEEVEKIRNMLYLLSAFLILGGILWSAFKMVMTRSGKNIAQVIQAALLFVGVSISSLFVVQGLSYFSDTLAISFFDFDRMGDYTRALGDTDVNFSDLIKGSIVKVIWSLAVTLGLYVQIFFLYVRDVTLVLASALLVLAASGQFLQFSQDWFNKIIGLLVALLIYKPAGALVLSFGLDIMAADSGDTADNTKLIGSIVIFASAWGISPLTKLFSNFSYGGGGGGGQQGMGAKL